MYVMYLEIKSEKPKSRNQQTHLLFLCTCRLARPDAPTVDSAKLTFAALRPRLHGAAADGRLAGRPSLTHSTTFYLAIEFILENVKGYTLYYYAKYK